MCKILTWFDQYLLTSEQPVFSCQATILFVNALETVIIQIVYDVSITLILPFLHDIPSTYWPNEDDVTQYDE